MKTKKNTHSHPKKTTFASLINDLNRWYGSNWWISGLIMTGVFLTAVILPGILG